jgi:hypothetical protein
MLFLYDVMRGRGIRKPSKAFHKLRLVKSFIKDLKHANKVLR